MGRGGQIDSCKSFTQPSHALLLQVEVSRPDACSYKESPRIKASPGKVRSEPDRLVRRARTGRAAFVEHWRVTCSLTW